MQTVNYGKYSTDDEQIEHNGTILSKIGLEYEDIKFRVTFDVEIELVSGTKYVGTVTLDMPIGDITTSGTTNYEKKDFSDIIFKRS